MLLPFYAYQIHFYRLVERTPQVRQPLQVPEQFLGRFTEAVPVLNISTYFDECCDVSTTYMGKVGKEIRESLIEMKFK